MFTGVVQFTETVCSVSYLIKPCCHRLAMSSDALALLFHLVFQASCRRGTEEPDLTNAGQKPRHQGHHSWHQSKFQWNEEECLRRWEGEDLHALLPLSALLIEKLIFFYANKLPYLSIFVMSIQLNFFPRATMVCGLTIVAVCLSKLVFSDFLDFETSTLPDMVFGQKHVS